MRKKPKLPTFRSDREERQFWSRHSVEEFASDLKDLNVEIHPVRTEQIALRLSRRDLETLRQIAEAKGVGHTTLARHVIERWLATAHAVNVDSGGRSRFPGKRPSSSRRQSATSHAGSR